MNPKPTSTALALALALSATTFVESISISTAGEVKSSDRQNDGIKKSYDRRRAEQQIISNTLHGISIHGSTIEVVDVGILAVEEDGHRHHDTMPLFRQRGVKVKVAASVSVSTVPRFLQEGEPTCAYPDTCEPNLCACTAKGGYGYDCAAELNAVCNKVYDDNGKVWTLEGCTGDVAYYANTYCPFAKCIVEGGAYGGCSCQFYQNVCDLYGDRQKYADEPNVIQSCAAASCCQNKTDEDGRRSCVENAHNGSTTSSSGESSSSMGSSPIASSNVPAPTSSGQGPMLWNNVLATSSLTVAAVAWSILC